MGCERSGSEREGRRGRREGVGLGERRTEEGRRKRETKRYQHPSGGGKVEGWGVCTEMKREMYRSERRERKRERESSGRTWTLAPTTR